MPEGKTEFKKNNNNNKANKRTEIKDASEEGKRKMTRGKKINEVKKKQSTVRRDTKEKKSDKTLKI